jgi:hypothetical protein
MGDGNGEAGRSGSGRRREESMEEGRGTTGKGGVTGIGGRRTTWAPSRHARCAAAAWQGEWPAHHEETTLKQTSDFSQEIRHTSMGDPVRFCMPSGDPGVGVG